MPELDEMDVRQWFKTVDLAQARDTFRVVEGILEMREASKPKRVRRKDAGTKRITQAELIQEEIQRDAGQPDVFGGSSK
jgi:hypothetical protein